MFRCSDWHHEGMSSASSRSPPGAVTAGTTAAPAKPRSGMRALIVEDEAALAGLLVSYFERDGFECVLHR